MTSASNSSGVEEHNCSSLEELLLRGRYAVEIYYKNRTFIKEYLYQNLYNIQGNLYIFLVTAPR